MCVCFVCVCARDLNGNANRNIGMLRVSSPLLIQAPRARARTQIKRIVHTGQHGSCLRLHCTLKGALIAQSQSAVQTAAAAAACVSPLLTNAHPFIHSFIHLFAPAVCLPAGQPTRGNNNNNNSSCNLTAHTNDRNT